MDEDTQKVFAELIVAASKLATVSDNAAVILSEEYDDMVTPFVIQVRAILARCPQPLTGWDGELRDDDILVKWYSAPSPQGTKRVGVELEHSITGSLARAIRRRPQKKTIMSLAKRWRQQLRNVIALYRSRKNLMGFVASIVKMRKGNEVRIVDGNLESPPEPVKQVTFMVFDDDQEWEAIVNFYDTPVDLMQDTIELVVEVIEKAKLEDAGS
jgi:hypothetical protein